MKQIIVAMMVVTLLHSQPPIPWKKIVVYGPTKEEAIASAHDKAGPEAIFGYFEYRFRYGSLGNSEFSKIDGEIIIKNEVCVRVSRNRWKCTLNAKMKPKK